MQSSVNQLAAVAGKRHARRQSYGKIMPISSLLNNLIGGSSTLLSSASSLSDERETTCSPVQSNKTPSPPLSPAIHAFEPLALRNNNNSSNRVNERSDSGDSAKNTSDPPLNFIKRDKLTEQSNQARANGIDESAATIVSDVDLDKAFLKCVNYRHSLTGGIEPLEVPANAKEDPEDDIDRVLVGENDDTGECAATCLICSNKTTMKHNLMNVLCKKLCDDSCNTSTKTCQSNGDDDATSTAKSDASTAECVDESLSIDEIRVKTESPSPSVKRSSNCSRQEFLASMLESDNDENRMPDDRPAAIAIDHHNDHDVDDDEFNSDGSRIAPLTVENLKQFNNDYFREKLAIAEALANTSMMTSPAAKRRLAARKIEMSLNTPDFVYDPENAEYIPPKELLMYLVR